MVHKAEMIVERFDRGITIRWTDAENVEEPNKTLAPSGTEQQGIGSEVWKDVLSIMEAAHADKVKINVEYELMK